MSDTERVKRWRQRQRQAGKEPLTIWLTTEEKLRLEDQALRQRCSPSELIARMLAQGHGESLPVTATVTDTEQIRVLVQQELALSQNVSATVADTVTATLHQALPGLVRALLQEQQPGSVTATPTSTGEDLRPETEPACVADTVADTVTDTTPAPSAKRKAPLRQRPVTDTVTDTVAVTEAALEPYDTARYVLGKLCPRGHDYEGTGQSLLRRTNRHCCACDREKFQERGKVQRQTRRQQQRQQEGQG